MEPTFLDKLILHRFGLTDSADRRGGGALGRNRRCDVPLTEIDWDILLWRCGYQRSYRPKSGIVERTTMRQRGDYADNLNL